MKAKPFLIAGLLAGAGLVGGLSLAKFTTGDDLAQPSVASAGDDMVDPAAADAPMLASVGATQGPETYTCHGCGPTLEEQRAKAEEARYAARAGYGDSDYDALPPYRPPEREDGDGAPRDPIAY